MLSNPVGLDVWFLVRPIFYFHTSSARTAKAPARLHKHAGSPEPSLVAWAFAGRLCDKYHNLMSWLNCNNYPIIQTNSFRSSLICICSPTNSYFSFKGTTFPFSLPSFLPLKNFKMSEFTSTHDHNSATVQWSKPGLQKFWYPNGSARPMTSSTS